MGAGLREDVEAADAGQPDIQQQQIDWLLLQLAQRFSAVARLGGVTAGLVEKRRDRVPQRTVVVDDEDTPAGYGSHLEPPQILTRPDPDWGESQ